MSTEGCSRNTAKKAEASSFLQEKPDCNLLSAAIVRYKKINIAEVLMLVCAIHMTPLSPIGTYLRLIKEHLKRSGYSTRREGAALDEDGNAWVLNTFLNEFYRHIFST